MKRWAGRGAAFALILAFLLPARAADLSVQAQSGETGSYGITIPFTRSPRTERYLFEVYDGASAQGEPLFTGKELEISVLGQMDIFLPLQYDLAGPHTYTLKITALPMPGREGLDLAASQTKTFQTGLVSTCGHSTADGGFVLGTGTESNPYRVASARQLDHVRQHLSDNFLQVAHIDVGETYSAWEPIGDVAQPFGGVYDGNGYEISALRLTKSAPDEGGQTFAGLFGIANGARLQKICLSDVTNTDPSVRGCGALLGDTFMTTVSQCRAKNVVFTGNSDKLSMLGGLVGDDYGDTTLRISDCYVQNISLDGNSEAGGLVGAFNTLSGLATNCYAVPDSLSSSKAGKAGGLLGSGGSGITGCFYLSNAAWNNGYGTPKTEAELKSAATFTGWDTNIWEIKDGSYPTLKIERPLP
ncbi:hypothetical protein [Harryflintia acetispora]|uniref:hypothetical protein n=1 Tax=Harryflintia acetispora TaxID=1849041 RepID=UPI001899B494|nr:hypothetical protein [Harryflintia acetispora]